MKIKFSKFERIAGLFVGISFLGAVLGTLAVAAKKGWFSPKVPFETELPTADGIHPGTVVQISGLRAGSVDDIELVSAEKVRVQFSIIEKFKNQVRGDSVVNLIRPFVIGDKVLEVTIGSENTEPLSPGALIPATSTFDVMDVISGRKLGPLLGTLDRLTENLRILGEAFADPKRTRALVKVFDRMEPLFENLNLMSQEFGKLGMAMNRNRKFDHVVENMVSLTADLNRVVPSLVAEMPDMGVQLAQIVKNLNVLTTEFQKLTPAITAIAPELPQASQRAIEALDETVVTLKAIQKSFLLRGNVKDVRDEESRIPAGK